MKKLFSALLFLIAGLLLLSLTPQGQKFGVVSSVSSSDTVNTLRNAVNDLIVLDTNFSTTTANTFTQAQTFSAGFVNSATSTGTKGFDLSGGCFAVNSTCLNPFSGTAASSTLLSDNNTFSGATTTVSNGITFKAFSLNGTVISSVASPLTTTNGQLGCTTCSTASAANPTGSVGLSAVNGSALTFMRSDGAPAIDQTIAPTWTGAHKFSGAGTTTIANGVYANLVAAPYFDATSTTATSTFAGGVQITSGTLSISKITTAIVSAVSGVLRELALSAGFSLSNNTLSLVEHHGFTYSTTTWTGTTSRMIETGYGEVWNSIRCYTNVGTLNVQFGYGTASTTLFNASTTNNTFALTSNNTMTAGNKVRVDIGTPASSPTQINCTWSDTI